MLDDLGYRKTTEIMTWIYDADFEFLNDESITRIIIGGTRTHDYRLRLLLAGIPAEKLVCAADESLAPSMLLLDDTKTVFILHDLTQPAMTKTVREGILAEIEKREAQK